MCTFVHMHLCTKLNYLQMRVFKHWWFQTAIPHPRTDYENFHFLTFSPALVHFFPISNNHLFFLKSYAIFLKSFFFPSIALQFLQAHLYRSWFSDLSLAQLASWSCFNLSSLLLKCISKNQLSWYNHTLTWPVYKTEMLPIFSWTGRS